MNRVLFLVLLVLSMKVLPAQELLTQGASPNLYLTHEVAAKETWFAIARKYNLAPMQIASYNKLSPQTPLEIGQSIKIPLTAANFTQEDKKNTSESLVPVYHLVQDKEWMYRISVNHNKVPIERLEKWNSIKSEEAKAGMKLIVGFLRQSNANLAASQQNEQHTPAQNTTASNNNTSSTTANNQQPAAPAAGNGGYFKTQFGGQSKAQSGVAGIFKSTSGWNDGKYYALMNNVTVGTIVKISLPQTSKTVYAKVLGELPEMKESAGLALRISDAAARELGATASKFSVDVAY